MKTYYFISHTFFVQTRNITIPNNQFNSAYEEIGCENV